MPRRPAAAQMALAGERRNGSASRSRARELGALDHDLRGNTAIWNERLHTILGHRDRHSTRYRNDQPPESIRDDREYVRNAPGTRQGQPRFRFRCEHRIVRANDESRAPGSRRTASTCMTKRELRFRFIGGRERYYRQTAGSRRRSARHRSSMRSARWPVALRTTSTTSSPCCAGTWP